MSQKASTSTLDSSRPHGVRFPSFFEVKLFLEKPKNLRKSWQSSNADLNLPKGSPTPANAYPTPPPPVVPPPTTVKAKPERRNQSGVRVAARPRAGP